MTNLSMVRDIKLGITMGDYNISIDTNRLPGRFYYLLNRKRKVLKDLMSRGFILVGSRALSCYKINGVGVLDREPNDWDFVITRDQFLEICRDYKIYDFDLSKSAYHLNKSFATISGSYGDDSNIFGCFIQLIIKDVLPNYIEKDGIRFASLDSIIESKMELKESKHKKDINNILLNIYFTKECHGSSI